jgi:hypothetical protein
MREKETKEPTMRVLNPSFLSRLFLFDELLSLFLPCLQVASLLDLPHPFQLPVLEFGRRELFGVDLRDRISGFDGSEIIFDGFVVSTER